MSFSQEHIQSFKERLNYSICLNLIKFRRNPNIAFKIEITEHVVKFLKDKYKVNGRFQKCTSIFSDLGLDSDNFYNENDSNSVRRDTFQIRIMKKKPLIMKSNRIIISVNFKVLSPMILL